MRKWLFEIMEFLCTHTHKIKFNVIRFFVVAVLMPSNRCSQVTIITSLNSYKRLNVEVLTPNFFSRWIQIKKNVKRKQEKTLTMA